MGPEVETPILASIRALVKERTSERRATRAGVTPHRALMESTNTPGGAFNCTARLWADASVGA
jgi:hypothetical protein